MTARRYRLEGRVQGVGFRAFTARLARSLGVRGAARNEPDGTVTVIAEGEEAALDRFRAGIERGPSLARVERVVESEATAGEGDSFDVRF
jgi:acylphosphatase